MPSKSLASRAQKLAQQERKFLASYDPSKYPRPSLAVDVALLTVEGKKLCAAVYQRNQLPQLGRFALPGGFVRLGESLDDAAARMLRDKIGLKNVFIEQLYTFGAPKRDPRSHIVSVAYVALVAPDRFARLQQYEATSAELIVPWAGETGGAVRLERAGEKLSLFTDHADILGVAVKRLRGKLGYAPIGFQLLGKTFTLRDLRRVHETILAQKLNKDSFRRRMLATGQLEATGEREAEVSNRPAELYRFIRRSAL